MPGMIASAVVVAYSKLGTRLAEKISFSALIGFQSFRILAELLIYAALLEGIAVIALTSMPTPLRQFTNEPSNIWVTTAPYTLLPGILVAAAIPGHLLVTWKLRRTTNA